MEGGGRGSGGERRNSWPPELGTKAHSSKGLKNTSANHKLQYVRDALREIGLPKEAIERAIQDHGEGGDLNTIAAHALNLDNPQAECIEEHLSDDLVSSDEDSESDSVEKWIQAAHRMGGSMTQPSLSEVNRLQLPDRNLALMPVKVEEITLELQIRPQEKGQHLHGEGWQDPICKLFQTENKEGSDLKNLDEGGGSKSRKPVDRMVDLKQGVEKEEGAFADSVDGRKAIMIAPRPLKDVHRPSVHSKNDNREALFWDMGFSSELIERAIQLHGAQTDDSTILQFLLDWRGNHAQQTHHRNEEDSESDLHEDEVDTIRENVAALVRKSPQTGGLKDKNVAEPSWDSEESDPLESDSDDDDEMPFRLQSPIDWAAEMAEFDKPASLCKREVSAMGGHRQLMCSHGFPPDLIERAIQELGEGVEYEMLLEYMLYLTTKQDPEASTSDGGNSKRVSTVEKLVTECGFPTKAVERAVLICNTPLWDAEQDQIVDLVDFLAAHGGQLNEEEEDEEEEAASDEDTKEDTRWTWLREQITNDVAANRTGKRKMGYLEVDARNTIVRRGRPPSIKRELANRADRPLIVKREPSTGRPPRVKLEANIARGNPLGGGGRGQFVARVGRPRLMREEVIEKVDKHKGSVGFGLPGQPVNPRYLSRDIKGAPFFYFENVASMPNDEWERIRRHLFDIEPEFVDSLHFSACRRPRGYIHNLPIEGRKKLLDDPPMTIQELLPHTRAFWPAWDPRTKLNCITTRMGSEFLAKKLQIREGTALQTENPSAEQQREILNLCRHWNLVWTAPNIPTPISENEIEAMLGFAADHSRNCLSSRARFKALGNSFSVYTVAFHFSVLKPLYPRGIKVLSLFSGIGGAEVALHKIGIKLLVVVSVEINDGTRRCLEAWWASSKQTGILNQNYHNVKDLGRAEIAELVNRYGGFDLIVGGSPCNNLSGSNHVTRVGLDGKQSTVFFEFSRIVTTVRELTIRLQERRR